MSEMSQSDQNTSINLIVPKEIMDGLDAASMCSAVKYISLAANSACAVIKLLQESKVIDPPIIQLVNRAAEAVVASHMECKRLIDSDLALLLLQALEDDARKLAGVFHDLEYECKRSYKKRYYMSIMGWIPKSIKKLNRRLDDLSIVQTNNVSDTNVSKNPSCNQTPTIAACGRKLAMVLNSGKDRTITTFVDSCGQATTAGSSNTPSCVLESVPRVRVERADGILVIDSGNNETLRAYLPVESSETYEQESSKFCGDAFHVFNQLADLEDAEIPSYVRERVARFFLSTPLHPQ